MLTERICCDLMVDGGDGERRAPIKRKNSGIHDDMNNIFGYYGYTFLHRRGRGTFEIYSRMLESIFKKANAYRKSNFHPNVSRFVVKSAFQYNSFLLLII